jgi:hypothetical protein
MSVFVLAAKSWNQSTCPSNEEWTKTMWCMHTMKYYSAMKKNKIMFFAGKWVELEIILPFK